ncbi:MAG: RDD family protein, partial [Flavobacteriales bacterium]
MKKAEILTANNVAIQYEMASLIQRILAFIIDGIVLLAYYFLLLLLISSVKFYDSSLGNVFIYVLFLPIFFFYNLIAEVNFNGQTIGKAAMGIRVIKLTGETPLLNDYFIRWTYRVIDIWLCAGALAAVFVSSSDKSQRLGDISANT